MDPIVASTHCVGSHLAVSAARATNEAFRARHFANVRKGGAVKGISPMLSYEASWFYHRATARRWKGQPLIVPRGRPGSRTLHAGWWVAAIRCLRRRGSWVWANHLEKMLLEDLTIDPPLCARTAGRPVLFADVGRGE